MKKRFKWLGLFMAIICMFLLILPTSAAAYEFESENSEAIEKNCQSQYNATRFKEKYTTITVSRTTQRSMVQYPDNYGGMYIDEHNDLHITYVNSLDTIRSASINDEVFYNDVDYSYNYLSDIVNCLIRKMVELSVSKVYVDEITNRVKVFVDKQNKIDVENYLKEQFTSFNTNTVVYCDAESIVTTDKAGSAIKNGGSAFTLGYNAYKSSTQKYGFVTCGHAVSVGDKVKRPGLIFSTTLGKVENQQFSGGTIDAAFVPYDKQTNATAGIGDGFFTGIQASSNMTVGQTLQKTGAISKDQTGEIESTSVAINYDGTIFYDQIQVRITQQKGDSGAPVYSDTIGPPPPGVPQLPIILYGIATFATSTFDTAFVSKVENINAAFGISTYIVS